MRERLDDPGAARDRGRERRRPADGRDRQQAAELFDAIVAKVPFVDDLTTMLDETLPLTVAEYEEWGDPEARGGVRADASYAPTTTSRRRPTPPCS